MTEISVLEQREPFFTIKTLANYLGLSDRYVEGLLKNGEIASYRFGKARRIAPEDVDSFVARRRDDRRAA